LEDEELDEALDHGWSLDNSDGVGAR
jgi:hypothetical protein